MSDEKAIDSNLEPINEDDFNLAKKFGHIEKNKTELNMPNNESEVFSLEKEAAKEVLATEKDSTYNEVISKISKISNNATGDDIKNDAQAVSQKINIESQIQHLVDLASTKGVVHAVKVAKHMDDNYILDTLHDRMISEELRKVLEEKNLLASE